MESVGYDYCERRQGGNSASVRARIGDRRYVNGGTGCKSSRKRDDLERLSDIIASIVVRFLLMPSQMHLIRLTTFKNLSPHPPDSAAPAHYVGIHPATSHLYVIPFSLSCFALPVNCFASAHIQYDNAPNACI